MGRIYKLVSPSGKIYIGQTIKSIKKRWLEHIEDATNPNKNHCKALNAAILKYTPNDFSYEEILECANDELDHYEVYYIQLYNTLVPDGYNIKLGGSSGMHSYETKQKISQTLKGRIIKESSKLKRLQYKSNPQLPMYMLEVKRDLIIVGYRITHPNGPEKRFLNSSISLDAKYNDAIEYLEEMKALQHKVFVERSLPKYIQRYGEGYCIKYPGHKPKYFVSTSLSNEEKLKKAKHFCDTIKLRETP